MTSSVSAKEPSAEKMATKLADRASESGFRPSPLFGLSTGVAAFFVDIERDDFTRFVVAIADSAKVTTPGGISGAARFKAGSFSVSITTANFEWVYVVVQ